MRVNVTPNQAITLLESIGRITVGKMITANELTEQEIKTLSGLFKLWVSGESVAIGDYRKYKSDLYVCLQAHTTQSDWTPDITPALWAIKSSPGGGYRGLGATNRGA